MDLQLLLSPFSGVAARRSLTSPTFRYSPLPVTFQDSFKRKPLLTPCLSSSSASITATPITSGPNSEFKNQRHWMVLVEATSGGDFTAESKTELVDSYVRILESVIGSEIDAQMCIYHVSCGPQYGFCCDVDEETSRRLADLPGVSAVQPDYNFGSVEKEYSLSNANVWNIANAVGSSIKLFPNGNTKHWLVRVAKPTIRVVTKAQMVDHFVRLLTKVMGNERDAQMCLYHVSWQYDFGFCCELDEECAKELSGIPGILSIQPDNNFESQSKNYRGEDLSNSLGYSGADVTENMNTKKLFVTGLSFYTSEKTLRAAFEGFGELVEVKIIMDKISKRSKGYAFIEYTTVEAASAAHREMNGKIINGWMIVVDVAKTSPPRFSRGRQVP